MPRSVIDDYWEEKEDDDMGGGEESTYNVEIFSGRRRMIMTWREGRKVLTVLRLLNSIITSLFFYPASFQICLKGKVFCHLLTNPASRCSLQVVPLGGKLVALP